VKILDFGISKFQVDPGEHRLTADGAALGTPYYMSPEQITGTAQVDARTDVYSLGVVLYECLCGQAPFQADALPALVIRIHHGSYTPLSERLEACPPEVDQVVARAMALDPNNRYQSAQAFREALLELKGAPAPSFASTVLRKDMDPGAGPPVAAVSAMTEDERANTSLEASHTAAPSPSEGGWGRKAAVLGVLLLGAGALWFITGDGGDAEPHPEPLEERQQSAISTPGAAVQAPAASTQPTPRASTGTDATPSQQATEASAPPRPAKATAPSSSKPKGAASASKPSRADRDGLSTDNPFSH
jgi:serine/threonine-protein kinase